MSGLLNQSNQGESWLKAYSYFMIHAVKIRSSRMILEKKTRPESRRGKELVLCMFVPMNIPTTPVNLCSFSLAFATHAYDNDQKKFVSLSAVMALFTMHLCTRSTPTVTERNFTSFNSLSRRLACTKYSPALVNSVRKGR